MSIELRINDGPPVAVVEVRRRPDQPGEDPNAVYGYDYELWRRDPAGSGRLLEPVEGDRGLIGHRYGSGAISLAYTVLGCLPDRFPS